MVLLDSRGDVITLVAAAGATTIAYYAYTFVQRRRFYSTVPCPPHSLAWGHLKLVGEYMARMPPGAYIQQALTEMKADYDLPDVFYLDMWPAAPGIVCLTSPEAASFPTTQNVWHMSQIVTDFFSKTTGSTFIEATNGPLWKELLHRLSPSLGPASAKTHFQDILKEAEILREDLDLYADVDAKAIDITSTLGRYPFQVISQVMIGERLDESLYQDALELTELQKEEMTAGALILPWKRWAHDRKLKALIKRMDIVILEKTRNRFAELQKEKGKGATQSVLDRLLLPRVEAGLPLDKHLEELCLSNIKGLIVAGYGTTSDTTTYIWLLLSTHPEILETLRQEHDRVFGPDLHDTITKLQENPALVSECDFTSAAITETLRLYPIGMSVRSPPDAKTNSFEINGVTYPLRSDQIVGIVGHAMHHNEEYFPEPKRFAPERWISSSPLYKDFPRAAYRAFERGPRGCIGQAIAMEEMKVQLIMLARSFDFELVSKEDVGSEEVRLKQTDLDRKLGKHAYQVAGFTAAPSGTVMMNVRRRER